MHFSMSYLMGNSLLRKKRCYIGFSKFPYYPWFAEGGYRYKSLKTDPLLLMCQKI